MVFWVILLSYVACSLAWRPSWMPPIHDTDCAFNRRDSYDCLVKYVDVHPKDGQITKEEAQEAISKYMPYWMRPIFWFAGSVDSVFEVCDYDHNNVLTPHDWEMTKDTCIPIKEGWCSVEWFCDRAKEINGDSKK